MVNAVTGYFFTQQSIEGNRIADLCWGTSNAKYAVFRCAISWYYSLSLPTTIGISIRNNPVTHSIVWSVPITVPYTWAEYTFVVPPCTVGTWATDNSAAMLINFSPVLGSNYKTATSGSWVAGNFLGTTAVPNSNSYNALRIADIGLYADPNMTGVAPEFQVPNYEDDLQDCLRYWYKAYRMDGVVNTTTAPIVWMSHYVPMRATPARTLVGNVRLHDISVAPNITSITNYNSNEFAHSLSATASGFTLGRPVRTLVDGQTANYIAVSARM